MTLVRWDGAHARPVDRLADPASSPGVDYQFWLNLQRHHDLEVELDALGDALDGITPLKSP